MTPLFRRTFCAAPLLLVPLLSAARADDRLPNSALLPATDAVTVELPGGTELIDHPLLKALRREITRSRQWEDVQASPQFDRLRFVAGLIEKATGNSWSEGLNDLTAGGVALSFTPGKTVGVTAIVAARDEKALKQYVRALQQQIRSRLPARQRTKVFVPRKRGGYAYTRVGPAAFAVVGRRLILGSTEARLRDALDRLQKASIPSRSAASSITSPQLRVSVNLKALPKTGGLAKALQLPAKNAGQVALLGGWIDLLRRSRRITAEVHAAGRGLEIRLRSAATRRDVTPGLEGFFADGKRQSVAPLLQIPETIYAASWHRDYRSLWQNRRKLLEPNAAKKLEDGDDVVKKQLAVIGAKASPSRAFSLLGTHFRMAVARQPAPEYKVSLDSRLPAGVLVVDLRDQDAFRSEVFPLLKGVGLILAFQQNVQTRRTTYKKAELTSLRFLEDDVSAAKGNRIRFNFSPTYTVTRGHLIAGTTATIVKQAIDDLQRQQEKSLVYTRATEIQRFLPARAAGAVKDFEWTVIRGLVLNGAYSAEEAAVELKLLRDLLQHVGPVTTEAGFDEKGFHYTIRVTSNVE